MALKIRLQGRGIRNRPVYKIVVAEGTSRRDGKFVEAIGNYDPNARGNTPELALILVGAKPTDTVKSLIKKARAVQISA
jgi:small subunit ribosomal protein S16